MSERRGSDGRLVKIVGSILQNAHDLAEWGLETKNLTEDDLRMIVLRRDPRLRREAAIKLIESGVSQRQAATLLGVGEATIRRDVRQSGAENAPKRRTGSAATKAHRAETAAAAKAGGATPAPTSKYRIVYADPPWDYAGHAQPDYQTAPGDYYPVMALDAICDVPVKDWVENDAVLFLWVPSPLLEKSFSLTV
jgi:predicted transcriptional regulator